MSNYNLDNYQFYFTFLPYGEESQLPSNLSKQDQPTLNPICKIKRRQIVHPSLKTKSKKNGNMPKSIIGNFCKYLPKYQLLFSSVQSYEETMAILRQWLKQRIDLGLKHLCILFKDCTFNLQNCRVMRQIISKEGLNIIGENTKVENRLSYLICLEKYLYRLGNPETSGRIQSK